MVAIINKNNPYFHECADYILKTYHDRMSLTKIKELIELILIDIQNKENNIIHKSTKLINIEVLSLSKSFFKINQKRLKNQTYLNESASNVIIKKINKYLEHNGSSVENPNEDDYRGAITLEKHNETLIDNQQTNKYDENNINYNHIIPNEYYSSDEYFHNHAVNIKLKHLFNYNIFLKKFNNRSFKIQNVRIKILSESEDIDFPIIYQTKCPRCDKIAKFTDAGFIVKNIYCNSTVGMPGGWATERGDAVQTHQIFSVKDFAKPCDWINFHGYDIEMYNPDNKEYEKCDTILYSDEKITDETLELQVIIFTVKKGKVNMAKFLLALGVNINASKDTLSQEIIKKHKNEVFYNDIFESLKKYLLVYHHKKINDNNKIVACTLIFTIISNLFYNVRFDYHVIGKSGMGKSFWGNIIPKLFTGKTITADGGSISKNRYLGGTSGKTNIAGKTAIIKGLVGSHKFIMIEEASNKLNDFLDKFGSKTNNIYSMRKLTSGGKVPITTQGTSEYSVIANEYLTGNLSNMNSNEDYLNMVSKEYKKLINKNESNIPKNISKKYISEWSLFRPLRFYIKKMNNQILAQAHFNVRTNNISNEKYIGVGRNNHYITRLPVAEMARFAFFHVIEGKEHGKKKVTLEDDDFFHNIHRNQILEELGLNKIDLMATNDKKYLDLKEEIEEYINEEFLYHHHNFNIFNDNGDDINSHIVKALIKICLVFTIIQKNFYNVSEYELTNEDKKNFSNFMIYNYNTLSPDEARMKSKPYNNDYIDFDKDMLRDKNINENIKESEEKEKYNQTGKEVIFDYSDDSDSLVNDMESMGENEYF